MKKKQNRTFIIDFDSTFVTKESLEEMANLVLQKNPKKKNIMEELVRITQQSMAGNLDYGESLTQKLALFQAAKIHIEKTISLLKKHITPSIKRNKEFFATYADSIYIISGGFREIIIPIVTEYGIDPSHVLANTFTIDSQGNITGIDHSNPSSHHGGKARIVRNLKLKGDVYVLGDGYNDYLIKKDLPHTTFFLLTENVRREKVVPLADHVISSFDEFLFHLNLPRAQSYPKTRMKVLVLESIHPTAIERFNREEYQIEALPQALGEKELTERIRNVSILCIRSGTKVKESVLAQAKQLLAIGAFCIGTNQIDLAAATQRGIAVFNAPYSNTRSVVELTIANMIALLRKVPEKNREMHAGIWNKSAHGSKEVRGKKLGIVGYGNIGSQLSVLAEGLGLDVYFYDCEEKLALGNATPCSSLHELLKISDILSLHVDGRPENTNLIGAKELARMKPESILLNASRGSVVDIDALVTTLQDKHLAGAALDVFPQEPKSKGEPFTSPLQGIANVILTPHIGGSTEEAQQNIGEFVSTRLVQFINTGNTMLSVNMPNLNLPELQNSSRIIHIHQNIPGIMAQITNILSAQGMNIEGQYLKTNEQIGYVITDSNKKINTMLIKELRAIPGTVRVRILY